MIHFGWGMAHKLMCPWDHRGVSHMALAKSRRMWGFGEAGISGGWKKAWGRTGVSAASWRWQDVGRCGGWAVGDLCPASLLHFWVLTIRTEKSVSTPAGAELVRRQGAPREGT